MENTIFVEQRAIMSENAILDGPLYSNIHAKKMAMPDEEWNIADMVTKPLRIASIKWAAQEKGSVILSVTIPQSAFKATGNAIEMQAIPHKSFTFQRSGWTIKIQINGTRFHLGRLWFFIEPFPKNRKRNRNFNLQQVLQYPGVMIDASSNAIHELDVPFVAPQLFSDTFADPDDMGIATLHCMVINKLDYSEGAATTLNVTVWEAAKNPAFHVPTYIHAYEALPQGVVETIQDFIRPIGQPIADIAKWIVGLAKPLLGDPNRDKPVIPAPPVTVHNRMVGPLSHGRGLDPSERLCLDPSVNTAHPPEFTGTTGDEMSLKLLTTIASILTQFRWSNDSEVGTSVFTATVSPMVCEYTETILDRKNSSEPKAHVQGTINKREYKPTMLAYSSVPFCFWNGGIKYTFQFVATQFHSGRLMAAFFPRHHAAAPTIEEAFSQPNIIMDLQERNEFEFVVPYNAAYPALQTGSLKKINAGRSEDFDLGILVVFVLNHLVRPDNIPTAIDVNVLVQGADDFQLMVPRAPLSSYDGGETAINIHWTTPGYYADPQSNYAKDENMREVKTRERDSNILQKGNEQTSLDNSWMTSENFMDLKDVLRRYQYIGTVSTELEKDVAKSYALPANLHNVARFNYSETFNMEVDCPDMKHYATVTTQTELIKMSLLTWYSQVYAFHRGSLRYKIIPRTTSADRLTFYVVHEPEVHTLPGWENLADEDFAEMTGYATKYMNDTVNGCMEIEVPYYTHYGTLINDSPYQKMQDQGTIYIFVVATEDCEIDFDLFVSIGDDFKFSYVIGTPIVSRVFSEAGSFCA